VKPHVYEKGHIVVGKGLEALLYAYLKGALYIQNVVEEPFDFEWFPREATFSFLSPNDEQGVSLRTDSGVHKVGPSHRSIWQALLFQMSLKGAVPFGGTEVNVRLRDQSIRVVRNQRHSFDFHFEHLSFFDCENVFGVPAPVSGEKGYRVYDWFDVTEGALHPYDCINIGGELAHTLYFYPTPRIDGNTANLKDVVAVSSLSEAQLHQIQYSDLYSRLKTTHHMEERGIRGDHGGRPKLRLSRRVVRKETSESYEFGSDNVQFLTGSPLAVLNEHSGG